MRSMYGDASGSVDLHALFDAIDDPEDEGLVLKNPEGKLTIRNNNWSVKARRKHENYGF